MGTVASPVSIREQALEVIVSRLGEPASTVRRLEAIGGAGLADLLIDLERRFDIGLEVDEVLPWRGLDVLLDLVELRALAAQAAARAGRVYHWDDERGRRGLPLHAPRPRLAATGEPCAGLAPPPWPSHYPETPRRIEIAVPSDAAWAHAAALYGRERARRARFLWLALACALAAAAAAAGWVSLAGWA